MSGDPSKLGRKIRVIDAGAPEPAVRDYDRINRAVVICDGGGDGMVIHYVGGHMEHEIEGASAHLGDLGLDDAPAGISIWEGRFAYSRTPESYIGAVEYDCDIRGEFRDPTDEEWEAIKQGECPWDGSMYQRAPYCDAKVAWRVEGVIDGKRVFYDVCEAHEGWPATRFTTEEVVKTPYGDLNTSFGRFLSRDRQGCYAERDGWEDEWEAWIKKQQGDGDDDAA